MQLLSEQSNATGSDYSLQVSGERLKFAVSLRYILY